MKFIELIIFDLDGTLIDSRTDIINGVNFTLKTLGLEQKGTEEISSYIGRGMEDLIRRSLGEKQDSFIDGAIPIFEEYYRNHSTDNTALYENVEEILEHFKDKKKVIVTNRNYEFALLALKTLGIYEYFEDVLGGDNPGCAKPSPCPVDKIVGSLNMNKEKTVIVGDMDIDILAGRRAGIITCAVTYGIGKKDAIIKAKPDFIIDNIIKLENIIH